MGVLSRAAGVVEVNVVHATDPVAHTLLCLYPRTVEVEYESKVVESTLETYISNKILLATIARAWGMVNCSIPTLVD